MSHVTVPNGSQKALGQAIRLRRHELSGISQEQLGDMAGFNRTYVGGVERGLRNPTYLSLLRLSQALRIPLSELIAKAERLDR